MWGGVLSQLMRQQARESPTNEELRLRWRDVAVDNDGAGGNERTGRISERRVGRVRRGERDQTSSCSTYSLRSIVAPPVHGRRILSKVGKSNEQGHSRLTAFGDINTFHHAHKPHKTFSRIQFWCSFFLSLTLSLTPFSCTLSTLCLSTHKPSLKPVSTTFKPAPLLLHRIPFNLPSSIPTSNKRVGHAIPCLCATHFHHHERLCHSNNILPYRHSSPPRPTTDTPSFPV